MPAGMGNTSGLKVSARCSGVKKCPHFKYGQKKNPRALGSGACLHCELLALSTSH